MNNDHGSHAHHATTHTSSVRLPIDAGMVPDNRFEPRFRVLQIADMDTPAVKMEGDMQRHTRKHADSQDALCETGGALDARPRRSTWIGSRGVVVPAADAVPQRSTGGRVQLHQRLTFYWVERRDGAAHARGHEQQR